MMRYSTEHRDHVFAKSYGFLSFVEKHGQKYL